MKNNSKWWCGYSKQEHVLLDELDIKQSDWLCNFLKRWTDRYPIDGEVKNGTVPLRYKKFYVTC